MTKLNFNAHILATFQLIANGMSGPLGAHAAEPVELMEPTKENVNKIHPLPMEVQVARVTLTIIRHARTTHVVKVGEKTCNN